MQRQLLTWPAALARGWATSYGRRLVPVITVPSLALLLQACAAAPAAPLAAHHPSNPHIRTPAVGYRSTIGSYTSMRPAEPAAWQKQNEQVAPASKPMQHEGM